MNIPYNYIQSLKLLPKQGEQKIKGLTPSEELSNELNKFGKDDNTLESLAPGYEQINKLILKFGDAISKSNTQFEAQVDQLRKNQKAVLAYTKSLTAFEQRNIGIQKTFKLNTEESAILGKEIDRIAVRFNRSGATVRKYTNDLNKLIPGFQNTITSGGKAGDSLLKIQDAFQEQLGLSGDLANSFALFSGGNEEVLTSQLQIVKGIEDQTDGLINARDIIGDVSALSANLQLQFGRIPGNLELAVLKARTLGVSFADIAKTGNELLNVESSINNELEYQLLSGKRLVDQNGKSLTQQFRTAAIQGDANAQADALTKIIETQGATIENNLFARQQLAKTLGMEEGQLSKIVQQRKLVSKLGAESLLGLQGADLQQGIENFKADFEGNVEDLDQLLATFDNRSTDERLVQVLGKLEATLGAGVNIDEVLKQQAKILKEAKIVKPATTKKDARTGETIDIPAIEGDILNFVNSGKKLIDRIQDKVSPTITAYNTIGPAINDIQKKVPIFGESLQKITSQIIASSQKLGNSGLETDPAVEQTITKTTDENDSIIRLNDAILFNPNDKFNIVASTSPGALDQATADISGRGQSNGPSAQEIGAAVAQALQGVNLYVSPNELAAEMAFNSYNINA